MIFRGRRRRRRRRRRLRRWRRQIYLYPQLLLSQRKRVATKELRSCKEQKIFNEPILLGANDTDDTVY